MRPDFSQPVNLYHLPSAGAGGRQDLSWFKSGVRGLTQDNSPFLKASSGDCGKYVALIDC